MNYTFADFIDDFVFGPLGLIGYIVAAIDGMIKNRPIARVKIRRFDKGGKIPVLDVIRHVQYYGVRLMGGTGGATHDARNIYIAIAKRQRRWFEKLYNYEEKELWYPKSAWKEQ